MSRAAKAGAPRKPSDRVLVNLRRAAQRAGINFKPFRLIEDGRVFAAIAVDYAVIVLTAILASRINRLPVTFLALWVIAGRQGALQGFVHSACHLSLFSRRSWNDRLEPLFAFPILDSVPIYRVQHLEHHRDFEVNAPDRYDYLHVTLGLARTSKLTRLWLVFIRPLLGHAGLVFLADLISTYREHPKRALKLAAFWLVLVGSAWVGGWLPMLLLYWLVPLIWLYPVLDIWSELSDHLNAKAETRNQEGAFYSVLIKGHELYHAVHHLYPTVPYYRLSELNQVLQERGIEIECARGPLDFVHIVLGADNGSKGSRLVQGSDSAIAH